VTRQRSIDSSEALFGKFERSFHRRPAYGNDQVDWVFDVAITSWHLVDWVARERGVALNAAQDAFKKKCPELFVCEQLCNGAKHCVLRDRALAPFDVATGVLGTTDLVGVSKFDLRGDTNVNLILTPAVVVIDKDGTSWEAIELFRRVLFFWKDELGLEFH
jgi:hypothetical protein